MEKTIEQLKILYGIFDFDKTKSPVGDYLGLLENLLIIFENENYEKIEICFLGNSNGLSQIKEKYLTENDKNWEYFTDAEPYLKSWLGKIALGMICFDSFYVFKNLKGLRKFLAERQAAGRTWPVLEEDGINENDYKYTSLVQEQFRRRGGIPYLECKHKFIKQALEFIESDILPSRLVSVHLKNSVRKSGEPDWYNAKFEEWVSFLEKAVLKFDVKFLLIGNEPLPEKIHKLPNVIISQSQGNSLINDLALIQASFAFMGSSSGPNRMAFCSAVPYLIYKHPDHHVDEMKKDLGSADHFNFAQPFQKLMRKLEDQNIIFSDFEELYQGSPLKEWEDRLKKLRLVSTQADG